MNILLVLFIFFKQKTAYEMRISDWSSDVCSSDLLLSRPVETFSEPGAADAMAVSPEPPEAFERGRLFAGIPLELLHKALEIFGPEFHAIASARDGGVVILAIDEARSDRGKDIDSVIGDRKSTRLNSSH